MLYLSLLLLLALPARALNPDGFETFIHIGHVFARSTVTNDDGAPLWAEYNDDGGHVRLRSLDGQYGDVYAGNQIRSFLETLKSFRERDQPIEDFERQFTTPKWQQAMFDDNEDALLALADMQAERWIKALSDNAFTDIF
ncbi:hypothetical protein [Venatorbacter sp. C2-1]|uniref:hypothetical protein n=2 Tax=Venatorbacter sp. C2-1 TaxID=2597518 RepID=UPI001FBA8D0E|nr:hypothetical protein [Thalassolituus sp. C2-1]